MSDKQKNSTGVYQRAEEFRKNVEMWRKWTFVFCMVVEELAREEGIEMEVEEDVTSLLCKALERSCIGK
jgi:hypothetical protein